MTRIKAGHLVRIRGEYVGLFRNPDGVYSSVGENRPGTEFVVTNVKTAPWSKKVGEQEFYALGDPNGWGIWLDYIERVA